MSDNLPVEIVLGLDLIQYSRMTLNTARREISSPYDTALLLHDTEKLDYEEEENISDTPSFGEHLTQTQVRDYS